MSMNFIVEYMEDCLKNPLEEETFKTIDILMKKENDFNKIGQQLQCFDHKKWSENRLLARSKISPQLFQIDLSFLLKFFKDNTFQYCKYFIYFLFYFLFYPFIFFLFFILKSCHRFRSNNWRRMQNGAVSILHKEWKRIHLDGQWHVLRNSPGYSHRQRELDEGISTKVLRNDRIFCHWLGNSHGTKYSTSTRPDSKIMGLDSLIFLLKKM